MAPRGRPRESPSQRTRRRLQRDASRRWRQQIAQYLRDAAAATLTAAEGKRRSLRLQWLEDNKARRDEGDEPLYSLVLFGEEDFDLDELPPLGYSIIVN